MTVIGITGGSGSGKSTLSALLSEEFDALALDADEIYHELLDTSADMRDALVSTFGSGILSGGKICRKALAAVVFADEEALARLNAITHPRVTDEIVRRMKAADKAVCSIDAFGLIQSGMHRICDHTVGVLADRDVRIRRIMTRDGLDEVRAAARIDAQAPEEFYRTHCDTLLVNNGSAEQFREDCRRFCLKLLGKDTIDHE